MAIIFSDDWSSGSINATNWLDASGTWAVVAGEVRCSQAAQRHLKTTTSAHAAIADVLVTVRRASGVNFDAGPVARSSITGSSPTVGSCYLLDAFGTNTIELYRRVTNVNTILGSAITASHADGDLLGLRVTGTGAAVLVEALVNGVVVGSFSDTDAARITAAGQTGHWSFVASSFMDDFSVDDLSGGSVLRKNSLMRLGVGR
jgi:hypothetical protein